MVVHTVLGEVSNSGDTTLCKANDIDLRVL